MDKKELTHVLMQFGIVVFAMLFIITVCYQVNHMFHQESFLYPEENLKLVFLLFFLAFFCLMDYIL